MKLKTKIVLFCSSLLLLLGGFLLAPTIAYASSNTNEILGPDSQLVSSQQIYTPIRKLTVNEGATSNDRLSSPEDMCVDTTNGDIFIADTNNTRIVKISYSNSAVSQEIKSYINANSEEIAFKQPSGITSNSNYVYVADKLLEKIVVLNKADLSFVKEITRPNSILVGSTTKFAPIKVSVDDSGNIYAVLEGLTKGVMQLDNNGGFISYIGANTTTMTLLARLQKFFGVSTNDYLLASGAPVTNIALDNKGLLYTVTNKTASTVKKLNTSGNIIMNTNYNDVDTVSCYIDEDGNIFSAQSSGYVTIYDSYGSLLFRFGGRNEEEIMGVLKSPIALALTAEKHLLVLDKEANLIIEYEPTYFANLVYKACGYYKDGLYLQGEDSWKEVLKYNSKFVLAYKALARASMKKGDYDTALKQFKIAQDKAGYSEAFWQIRDRWIRANLGYIVIPLVILVLAWVVLGVVNKYKPTLFAPVREFTGKVKRAPFIKDMGYTISFIKNPREGVYGIKFKKSVSLIGAIALYVFFVALQILKVYLTGYLFNNVGRSDGLQTILMSTLPILLLIVCNYYVSTVRDGEGKLKDIFISFIYALSPYLLLSLPLFFLSNVFTYNEQAIYYIIVGLVYAWCGVNILLTVMELHDYSLGKAIINILLTLVCFILVIAFAFILYVLGYQLVMYIVSVIKEAIA